MQSRDINRAIMTKADTVGPALVVNYDDDFSFTGFGSKDPRRKILPNAGTYTILRGNRYMTGTYIVQNWRIYPNGSITSYSYKDWYGALYTQPSGTNLQNQWHSNSAIIRVAQNKALTELYDRVRGSGLNALVSAGEYAESKRMIAGALHSAGSLIRSARRLRKLLLSNPSLVLSSGWLAYTYGWKPLMQDIYNATEFHYRLLKELSTNGKAQVDDTDTTKATLSGWVNITTKKTLSERALYGLTVGVDDTASYNLSRITSLNPLSIAWELMPLSFVADWFVDIGGYLSNMEASCGMGLSFKRGYFTRTTMDTVEKRGWGERNTKTPAAGYWIQNADSFTGYGKTQRITKARSVLTSFPRPNFPAFQVSLGARRIMSAASLIRVILLPKSI